MPNKLEMISDKDFHIKFLPAIEAAIARKEYSDAWSAIEQIKGQLSPEKRAHCFLLRGEIRGREGDSEEARVEWAAGLASSKAGSFGRFNLDYALGKSYERAGLKEKALASYFSAITTCAEGRHFSGNRALAAFLTLNDGQIPIEHKEIVASAIRKSWKVLEIAGKPDLSNLPKAIAALSLRFEYLLRKAKVK